MSAAPMTFAAPSDISDRSMIMFSLRRASRAPKYNIMIRSFKGVTPQFPDTAYIDDSAQLIGDVIIGEHSSVWMNAVLRGDVHQIRVGHNAILHGCKIEARCLIGMGSIILNGADIGSGSIIAAGTLIPEKTIV